MGMHLGVHMGVYMGVYKSVHKSMHKSMPTMSRHTSARFQYFKLIHFNTGWRRIASAMLRLYLHHRAMFHRLEILCVYCCRFCYRCQLGRAATGRIVGVLATPSSRCFAGDREWQTEPMRRLDANLGSRDSHVASCGTTHAAL
jgi:hypothetical protein